MADTASSIEPDRALKAGASVLDRTAARRAAAAFWTLAVRVRTITERLVEKDGSVCLIRACQHQFDGLGKKIVDFFFGFFPMVVGLARVTQPLVRIEDEQVRRWCHLRVKNRTNLAVGIRQQRNLQPGLFPELDHVRESVFRVGSDRYKLDTIAVLVDCPSQMLVKFRICLVFFVSRALE